MSNSENGLLKFITCGSVDDGKSTLIGHILYDSKLLYADQENALILDSQVGSRGGKIDYSLLLDGLMAEREQGITIDVAYRYFTTEKRSFIVADTPGHEEYTRNMAVGASFADLAVILVDATQGVLQQTRRHARICALMGIRHFVFAVNKMDLAGYSQQRFENITQEIEKLGVELKLANTVIIPVSATEGDNITRRSENMPWYGGDVLLSYLETVAIGGEQPEAGFYMPVQRVCRPDHTFRGFQGQVEAGTISVNDELTALPSGETAIVKAIYIADVQTNIANVGQPVTIQLDREVDVSRGCVLAHNAELKTVKEFEALLLWMDDQKLIPGDDYWIKLGTRLLPAIVTGIRHKVDVNTGAFLTVDSVGKNEIALCEIVMSEPAVLDEFRLHKTLGELILIDRVSHATAACGVIETVSKHIADEIILRDGSNELAVGILDSFYYHPDIHAVLRHSPPPAVYKKGDSLPLQGTEFSYPEDFDISAGFGFAGIRKGIFTGFGERKADVPLLDKNGIQIDEKPPRNLGKYRRIAVWEEQDGS
ncbi:MAG: sulfate adenylyltransferase subunit CysN [Candidatus Fibromonas sp.]|jgi:sulfate adenylyltransferase subunit 1|nr:sulfate adenylyltransferase subunit CysN [Candidatus Fibromonas sp.]